MENFEEWINNFNLEEEKRRIEEQTQNEINIVNNMTNNLLAEGDMLMQETERLRRQSSSPFGFLKNFFS